MAKGSRGAFAYVKNEARPPLLPYSLHEGCAMQASVNKAAKEWDGYCEAASAPTPLEVTWPLHSALDRPTVEEARKAALTFPLWTGLGIDGLHMRVIVERSRYSRRK